MRITRAKAAATQGALPKNGAGGATAGSSTGAGRSGINRGGRGGVGPAGGRMTQGGGGGVGPRGGTTAMKEVITEEVPGVMEAMEVHILTTGEFSDLSSWETTVTVTEICMKTSHPTTRMTNGTQSRTKAQERTQTIVNKRTGTCKRPKLSLRC